MRTTRRTGALWFAERIATIRGLRVVDNDGTYFFPNGGLVRIDSMLPKLRRQYSKFVRLDRLGAMRTRLGELQRLTRRQDGGCCNPGPFINQEIGRLRQGIAQRENFLARLFPETRALSGV